ncbi:MAG: HAD family hydrolase [Clostridia bacterium]|nr:HAD family hydrolase [Clostridia bacterium]
MDIRWIFFDIGYTLINEDAVWQKRFEEQAKTDEARLLALTPERIRQEIGQNTIERKPQYRSFVQKYGLHSEAPYRHEFEVLYSDTLAVLKALSSHYRLGIIANQSAGLENRLKAWGLLPFFSTVVSSWEWQIMKPDIRLFEAALAESSCNPYEAVMVGDRLDNDILPAKMLGMHTVRILQGFGVLQKPLSELEKPDYVIHTLSELIQLF